VITAAVVLAMVCPLEIAVLRILTILISEGVLLRSVLHNERVLARIGLHSLQLQPAICSERISAVQIDQIGLLVGANVSSCSAVKRLVVSEARLGRADDEGNDLLLNSEKVAGGVVVSKEEVAAGRKVAQKKEEPSSELIVDLRAL
jgi:hypothetical protein